MVWGCRTDRRLPARVPPQVNYFPSRFDPVRHAERYPTNSTYVSGQREKRIIEKENNFGQPGDRFRSFDPARKERFIGRIAGMLSDPRCTQVPPPAAPLAAMTPLTRPNSAPCTDAAATATCLLVAFLAAAEAECAAELYARVRKGVSFMARFPLAAASELLSLWHCLRPCRRCAACGSAT